MQHIAKVIIKAIAIGMVLLLSVFAIVQCNDPDGWLWFMIYGYAVALGVGLLANKAIFWLAWLGVAIYSPLALYLIPSDLRNWIEVEVAREGFGAMICAVWCLFVAGVAPRGKRKVEA